MITAIVSSSPIPSHPSTAMVEETIASIRYHLPDALIYVMIDGLRSEQSERAEAYGQYIDNFAALKLPGVVAFVFDEFLHQAEMTRRTLEYVQTPLMLFVEHDTPLRDAPIDWPMIMEAVMSGQTHMLRLHYDEEIHPDHQSMMHGHLTPNLIKTSQWHQRPHLARTDWYAQALASVFTPESRTFIEDKIYSPVSYENWEKWRLTVYDPNGNGQEMKRSRDLNGRATDPKYGVIF